ncbi:MAG: hypothetical protein K2J80_03405 [Oscillospiraceae bacterium]|nr:hypothetical protein [Oscillospiraceae bacterium]
MKKVLAVIALIVLNALAFSAGVWAVFGSWSYHIGKIDLLPSILFLAVLPSPLVFVWHLFRDRFDFSKGKFFLCILLPPYIVTAAASAIMLVIAGAADSGGWGGLAALAIAIGCHIAKAGLIVSAVVWVTCDELFERIRSDRLKKALVTVLLTVCGVFLCGKLHGLLDLNPLSRLYAVVYVIGTKPPIVSHITGTLAVAVILAVPIGAGASALMRACREEYSLKAPLFMLCAFLPTLLISGGITAARYFNDKERYFYHQEFTDSLDTLLFTAIIAVMSVMIYAVSALIRSRRHCY